MSRGQVPWRLSAVFSLFFDYSNTAEVVLIRYQLNASRAWDRGWGSRVSAQAVVLPKSCRNFAQFQLVSGES